MRSFRALALITVIATVILIAVGSTVRTTGSGLGCPDWPLCYGAILPPLEIKAILEWVHRGIAGVISVLVGLEAIGAFMLRRRDPTLWRLSLFAVVLLIVQALLGGVTVLTGNAPWTVGVHLAAALALLAIVTMIAALAFLGPGRARIDTRERQSFVRLARWCMLVTAGVLLIGAYTVSTNAGYGCTTWPSCREGQIPFLSGERLQHIQWLHRFTVLAGAAVVAWLFFEVRSMVHAGRMLQRGAHSLIGLYGVQIVIGGLNPLTGFSEAVRVAHLAVAAAIWAVMIAMWYAGQFRPEAPVPGPSSPAGATAGTAHV